MFGMKYMSVGVPSFQYVKHRSMQMRRVKDTALKKKMRVACILCCVVLCVYIFLPSFGSVKTKGTVVYRRGCDS